MSEVKWIKISTDIFNNRKIRQILKMQNGDKMFNIWVRLLCLTGIANNHGFITLLDDIPYTIDMLVAECCEDPDIVKGAIELFLKFGMIGETDGTYYVNNWEEYQNIDGMEKIKEQSRERQRRFKEKTAAQNEKRYGNAKSNVTGNVTGNVTKTLQSRNEKRYGNASNNVTVTHIDIDIDKDIDIENKKEDKEEKESENKKKRIGEKRSVFRAPTLDEVQAYCQERNNSVDADRFIDYYTSNGWLVGKNKMKDWRAAVRTWEKNGYDSNTSGQQSKKSKAAQEMDDWYGMVANWVESGGLKDG